MAVQGYYVLKEGYDTGDNTLPKAYRDNDMVGIANDGERFLFDTTFGFSYPGGDLATRAAPASPTTGHTLYDIAEIANGVAQVAVVNAISYAGGGFDFSGVTAKGNNNIQIPASVAADFWTAYGGNSQLFMGFMYLKMPNLANWTDVPSSQFFNSAPLLTFCNETGKNWGGALIDFFSVTAYQGGMYFKRMTSANTYEDIACTWATISKHAGLFTQIAFWRSGTQRAIRFKSSAGVDLFPLTGSGTANSVNFSAKTCQVGITDTMGWPTTITNAHDFRIYRVKLENLARSGRDPVTTADADWAWIQTLIAASAAANGGTSIIYV